MDDKERIAKLERIIRDTIWMACRYAHGRQSYAVGMYNRAARDAVDLEVIHHGASSEPIFAIDGFLTAEMSGLSDDEFERAWWGWSAKSALPNHCRAQCAPPDPPPGTTPPPHGG